MGYMRDILVSDGRFLNIGAFGLRGTMTATVRLLVLLGESEQNTTKFS